MNDPRGSVWRKWDLHIHTPASFHWKGGKRFREMTDTEKAAVLDEIVQRVRQTDVAAFGIMDYWTFDGYWALRDHLASKAETLDKTVFPGMELRIEAPVEFKLNIHVILSDSLSKQQLQDFKGALRISIGNTDRPLSDESLIELAQTLDQSVAAKYGFSLRDLEMRDKLLELGSKTAKITRESLKQARTQIPQKACLVILPYDTSGGLKDLDWVQHPYDDSIFMHSAHIFETRDPANVDLFLNRETDKNRHFIANFLKTMGGKPKPAISGSDAHKVPDYGVFPNNRITWIKADPTFEGLLQVTNEPAERSFIGDIPPKLALVQQKKTKYIESVEIRRKPDARLGEVWFDNTIPINPDLIAIIGNKGKGKSALTDTIGLLANTKQHGHFTFLSEKHFRQPKENKAKHFQATLTWAGGAPTTKGLDEPVDEQRPELVKYIPQNFLETICTQLSGIEETEFDRELKKVIFSHVDYAARLDKASLDDLIEYKTMEANDKIQIVKQEMHKINEETVSLEEKSQPEHRQSIENFLKLKKEELDAHEKSKPEGVQEPTNDPQEQEEISRAAKLIDDVKSNLAEYEKQIEAAVSDQAKYTQLIAVVDKLVSRVENLERQIQSFTLTSEPDFASIGLTIQDVVKTSIDKQPLVNRRQSFAALTQEAQEQQNPSTPNSPAQKKIAAEKEIEGLQTKLDEPNKRYQAYLTALKAWEGRGEEIIGGEGTPGTIKFYEKQLSDLDALPGLLFHTKSDRLAKAKELHGVIRQLAQTYRDLYAPVNQSIESRPLAKEKFHLNFEVGVVDTGFENSLFEFVSQGVTGTFCGVEEGHKRLKEILARQDLNTEEGIEAFLTEIMDAFEKDKRPGGEAVRISSQMRKGKTVLALYDYIFSLDYLKPRYALRMGDKELNQLSPGERGTLLLVFYLLVDKDDIPLVIDQPEENLDNQTVYDLLVPCVKEAKRRRQIFIVTHNPNLAVVCDAEQIIWADLDKKNNHLMRYTSGAIESQILNRATVDILEGTMPAFDNRDSKYLR
jgi:ABC-type lipoprotein export system ATPase subunit